MSVADSIKKYDLEVFLTFAILAGVLSAYYSSNSINTKKQVKMNEFVQKYHLPEGVTYKCIIGKIHYEVDGTTLRYEPLTNCDNK
ncbi:MAG: hypothetical protein K0U21_08590 [Proteobacteria bacterium]|nr:hypothetical protein [Pseudomonadota bacterium]